MAILKTILFILWVPFLFQGIAFWTHLWQKADYRYDRTKTRLKLPSSRKLLTGRNQLIISLLLLLSLAPFSFLEAPVTIIAILAYTYFAIETGKNIQEREFVMPAFTFRATSIFITALIIYTTATWSIFIYLNEWFVASILGGSIILPLLVSLVVLISNPVFDQVKKAIIKRAIKKISSMNNILVVALAGSYGKSSIAHILHDILESDLRAIKTPPHLTTDIGIARFILKELTPEHEVLIAEVGAKRKEETFKITQMLSPHIGVLAGITSKDTAFLGSMRDVQEAHYELIQALPDKSLAIFNGDDEYTRALFKHCKKAKRLYASDPLVETSPQKILFENAKSIPEGIELQIREKGCSEETLRISLIGEHAVSNVMGALTIARELGIPYKSIKEALIETETLPRTLEIRRGIKDTVVIDDTGSSNLNGVISALALLKKTKGRQKICIFQPIGELGTLSEKIHKQIALLIAETCDVCIVTSVDNFSAMYNEAMENGMKNKSFICISDPHKALRKAQEVCDKDDIILLENPIPEKVRQGLLLNKK
ncbi:MAG: Mur ligase family protein [Candidatus Spechtbacterales bacterium]|nr:Mur ligase family protein [Candidatus Spechtbacterales bacterium]